MKYKDLFEMERRSPNYRFTHVTGDPDTEAQLAQLTANITDHNKQAGDNEKLRVLKMPRLGRNNPDAHLYSRGTYRDPTPEEAERYGNYRRLDANSKRGSLAGTNTVHVDHAQRTDVYVTKRDKGWIPEK